MRNVLRPCRRRCVTPRRAVGSSRRGRAASTQPSSTYLSVRECFRGSVALCLRPAIAEWELFWVHARVAPGLGCTLYHDCSGARSDGIVLCAAAEC